MLLKDSVISKLEKQSCIESSLYCCFHLLASSQSLTYISFSKMLLLTLELSECHVLLQTVLWSAFLFQHCMISSLSSSITKFVSKYFTNSVDTCIDDDPTIFSFFFKKLPDEPLGPELLVDVEVPYIFYMCCILLHTN